MFYLTCSSTQSKSCCRLPTFCHYGILVGHIQIFTCSCAKCVLLCGPPLANGMLTKDMVTADLFFIFLMLNDAHNFHKVGNVKTYVFCINFDFSVKKNCRQKRLCLVPTNVFASMSCLTTKLVYIQYPLSTNLE